AGVLRLEPDPCDREKLYERDLPLRRRRNTYARRQLSQRPSIAPRGIENRDLATGLDAQLLDQRTLTVTRGHDGKVSSIQICVFRDRKSTRLNSSHEW